MANESYEFFLFSFFWCFQQHNNDDDYNYQDCLLSVCAVVVGCVFCYRHTIQFFCSFVLAFRFRVFVRSLLCVGISNSKTPYQTTSSFGCLLDCIIMCVCLRALLNYMVQGLIFYTYIPALPLTWFLVVRFPESPPQTTACRFKANLQILIWAPLNSSSYKP